MALFGTDGIRGVANAALTPELALAVGRAVAAVLGGAAAGRPAIVVGRDTRISGPMLEAALVAGVVSCGSDVLAAGIVPTPGVAMAVREAGAAAGVMISASHNPIGDNGIKVFGPDGFKLPDAVEARIEAAVAAAGGPRPTHEKVGVVRPASELAARYVDRLVDGGADLRALTVVVDAAFGAAYDAAPRVFERLGARVVTIHAEPDGSRINVGCGTTDMAALAGEVRRIAAADRSAHVVGVAFDGDADRTLLVDEGGAVLSGDHVMLMLARRRKATGALPGDAIVGTVMSNLGLERALAQLGIALVRTPVGDRYVLEAMRAGGFALGGEQSGHIVDLDLNTTGDGPATAVAVLSLVVESGATLRELASPLTVYPQVLLNVRTQRRDVSDAPAVRDAVAEAERALAGSGRILVRPSGTEPLVRVMVEGSDDALVRRVAGAVADVIRSSAAEAASA